jgi:hypothetical protein
MPKKKAKVEGAALTVHKHLYQGDGIPDHRGEDRCGTCGLDEAHRVHQLEPVDPAAAELGQRITGERGGS